MGYIGQHIIQWDMFNLRVEKGKKYTAKYCAHVKNYKWVKARKNIPKR